MVILSPKIGPARITVNKGIPYIGCNQSIIGASDATKMTPNLIGLQVSRLRECRRSNTNIGNIKKAEKPQIKKRCRGLVSKSLNGAIPFAELSKFIKNGELTT